MGTLVFKLLVLLLLKISNFLGIYNNIILACCLLNSNGGILRKVLIPIAPGACFVSSVCRMQGRFRLSILFGGY